MKYRALLLEESCNKQFSLMNSYQVQNSSKPIYMCWLVKVRGHLEKDEKEQLRIKQKKLPTLSGNSSL